MAFVKVEKRSYAGNDEPQVTMGAYLADGKKHKSKSVAFRVTQLLVRQLGWSVVADRYKIAVLEGTGEDAGFIQLVQSDDGYVAGFKDPDGTRQGIGINVTIERFKHYTLNECPVTSQPVNHIVEGNTLIVECPDWLRFNPTSAPEPEPKPKANVEMIPNRHERRVLAKFSRR